MGQRTLNTMNFSLFKCHWRIFITVVISPPPPPPHYHQDSSLMKSSWFTKTNVHLHHHRKNLIKHCKNNLCIFKYYIIIKHIHACALDDFGPIHNVHQSGSFWHFMSKS